MDSDRAKAGRGGRGKEPIVVSRVGRPDPHAVASALIASFLANTSQKEPTKRAVP